MVALRGTVRARGVLTGTVSPSMTLPRYPGPYDVTPAAAAQVLATKGLAMSADVTVGGMGDAIEEAERDAMRSLVDGSFTGVYRDEEVKTVNPYAFAGMNNLVAVDLPNLVGMGAYSFYECSSLSSVELPLLAEVSAYGFQYDTSLESINLPQAVAIKNNGFYGCSALMSVSIPALASTASSCFQGCVSLASVRFPSLTATGWKLFGECSALEMVDLTACFDFGTNSFDGCSSLTAVIIRRTSGTAMLRGIGIFAGTPIANGTGYIYVPRALVDKYKAATNWSVYADQIRAIEDYPDICDPD